MSDAVNDSIFSCTSTLTNTSHVVSSEWIVMKYLCNDIFRYYETSKASTDHKDSDMLAVNDVRVFFPSNLVYSYNTMQ